MGTDQVAAIRPMLVELEDAHADNSVVEYCASFQVSGQPAGWAEVIRGTLNVAYPFEDNPQHRLERLGLELLPDWALTEWQPRLFATFTYDPDAASNREVATVIDKLLGVLLGFGDDYPIDVGISALPQ